MAGKAKERRGFGKKLKDKQVTNKELYNISANIPIQSSSSAVVGGSQGGGTVVQVAAQDIYMNTYDIVDIDRLKFAVKEGAGDLLTNADYGIEALYVGGEAHGMWFRIPAESAEENPNSYLFYHGDDIKFRIDTDECAFNDDLGIVGYLDMKELSNPDEPSANYRRIFVDQDNSDHLTVKRNDGTEIDLESGVWNGSASSDLDMNTYDIIDIDNLQFTADSGTARDNAKAGMYATDTSTVIINHGATKNFRLTENGTYYVEFDKDELVPRLDDDYNLGTATKRWAGIHAHNFECHKWLVMQSGAELVGDIIPALDSTEDLGSSTKLFRTVYADKVQGTTLQVTDSAITSDTGIALQIPYLANTNDQSSGANTTLDGWFGNQNGCVGIQFDSDASAGSGKYRFWIRANDEWYRTEAY